MYKYAIISVKRNGEDVMPSPLSYLTLSFFVPLRTLLKLSLNEATTVSILSAASAFRRVFCEIIPSCVS